MLTTQTMPETLAYYVPHTPVSEPGASADWLAALPTDVAALSRIARELVFHYRGGDFAKHAVPTNRLPEIHSRYADVMLDRLRAADPRPLGTPRAPVDRTIGCCRDFALLMVTLARHQGIPARLRVGFTAYAIAGVALDHAVAEVWDEPAGRWRLVDPQLSDDHRDPTDDEPIDRLDVPRDRFLTGGDAWTACRAGRDDPARFLVDPGLPDPMLRGWPYLAHNLVLDLAALNRDELLLWDSWEFIERDPTAPAHQAQLDQIAAAIAGPDPDLAAAQALYARTPGLRAPNPIRRYDPLGGPPQAELRRA